MPDEHKPVICPCGKEMELWETAGTLPVYKFIAYYQCGCGWTSPVRDGTTREETIEAAYEAATRRPENRPLTLPELFDLDPEADAVWVVTDNDVCVMNAEAACEWASDADIVLFFAAKPTPADIEAARSSQNAKNDK